MSLAGGGHAVGACFYGSLLPFLIVLTDDWMCGFELI